MLSSGLCLLYIKGNYSRSATPQGSAACCCVVAVHIKLGGCVHLYSVYAVYSDAVYSVNLTISSVASQSAGVCQALHEIFQYKSHLNMNR